MKRTPLNEVHKKLGGRMVDFAGWEMPVQYTGVIDEHRAVRNKVGLFDISHMGEIEITGSGALELVQKVTCNDAGRLVPGQSQYSALLTPEGTFIDDIYVYCLETDRYLLCVNASNTDSDFEWIASQATATAAVKNKSAEYSLIALQGPLARRLRGFEEGPRKNRMEQREVAGTTALVSGTGYTGEDGFEIYCRSEDAEKIWNHLLELGRPIGIQPCGLGARDTLRLEAAYPLYGHEINREVDPFSAGLGWIVKMEKTFIGREALERHLKLHKEAPQKRLIGLVMKDRGIARQGYGIFPHSDREAGQEIGQEIGKVTSGTYSPTLDKPIALGYVDSAFAETGGKIRVDIHHEKREAVVVPLPFYKRAK